MGSLVPGAVLAVAERPVRALQGWAGVVVRWEELAAVLVVQGVGHAAALGTAHVRGLAVALLEVADLAFEVVEVPAGVAAGGDVGGVDEAAAVPVAEGGAVDGEGFGGFAGGE